VSLYFLGYGIVQPSRVCSLPYPKSRFAEDLDVEVVNAFPAVDHHQIFTYSAQQLTAVMPHRPPQTGFCLLLVLTDP
jgi:hypothetical protein